MRGNFFFFFSPNFCSLESVTLFLLYSSRVHWHADTRVHAQVSLCCSCHGVWCRIISGRNQSESAVWCREAGEDIRPTYYFPFIRKEKRDLKCVCVCVLCEREGWLKQAHESNTQNTFWGDGDFDCVASLMKALLCVFTFVCVCVCVCLWLLAFRVLTEHIHVYLFL